MPTVKVPEELVPGGIKIVELKARPDPVTVLAASILPGLIPDSRKEMILHGHLGRGRLLTEASESLDDVVDVALAIARKLIERGKDA